MAALTTKTPRPAGEGREPKDGWENDRILKAAINGDIDTLVSMSNEGIDVTTAHDWVGTTVHVLHEASRYGHHELLQHLLTTGIAVDVRNDSKWTALHWAALNGKNECILLLCSFGAAVNAKTRGGSTPLHRAAINGHSKAIEILIAAGATVDVKDNRGSTPLHGAASGGHSKAIDILIAAGATVDVKDNDGETPLHEAASHGDNKAIDILMAAGAKVDVKNNDGETPLADAVMALHDKTVHTLIYKYKADPSKVKQRHQQKMKDILKKAEEKIQDSTNETSSSSHDPQQGDGNTKDVRRR